MEIDILGKPQTQREMKDRNLNKAGGMSVTIKNDFDNFTPSKGKRFRVVDIGATSKEMVDLIGGKFVKLENS